MIKFIRSVATGLLIIMAGLALLSWVSLSETDDSFDNIPAKESIRPVALSLSGLTTAIHYADGYITIRPQKSAATPYDQSDLYSPHIPGTENDTYYSDAFYLLGGDRLKIIIYTDTPQDAGFGFTIYRYTNGERKFSGLSYTTDRSGTGYVTIVNMDIAETGQFQFVLWNKTNLSQKCGLIFYLH
ncbi:hypothetical protein [Dehalococcoides mccartyi]|uniref:hypothetical protein n=1 Tax=Dehalococcoides mccartyi TaxID=61435 RepID=UPI0001BDCDB9|nr:hypothetical protein [Dehalococcoides mccartyi]AGG05696.1 hypothetical protein dcmb_63 [Dehalococcoides mccartyi DCMB5]AQX72635.1 hypothetical protein B1775_00305 [Dehalococcoides mccartyi]